MATNQPNNLNINANFKPVIDSINNLIKALDRLEVKLTQTVNKLNALLQFRGLQEFIDKLKALASSNTTGLLEVAQAMSRIGFAAQQVRLIAQADITQGIANLTALFDSFVKLSAIQVGGNAESLQKFSVIIRNLALSLKPLNNEIGKLNSGKVLFVLGKLALVFQGLSLVLSKLPGANAADQFSKVLQRLGIAFGGLAKGISVIDNRQLLNLVKTMAVLAGATRIISTLAGLGPKAETFANVLAQVARALGVINSISNSKKQQKFDLKKQIGFILEIVKAFGSLKGKPIPNVGEALNGITNFIQVMNKSNLNFDASKLKGFSGFVKELAKGLKQLNSVKIDPNAAGAIGNVLNSLGGGSKLAQQVNRNVFNDSFFNTIKTGFGLRFGAVIFDALTALPRTIAKGLLSSTQLFRNFARDVSKIIEDTGQRIRTFGQTLISFGQTLTRNFGIGKFIQSSAFEAAAGFDEISARLKTFGQLTDEQLAKAQAFANEIGIKYPLSANEALQATLDLIKAGEDLSSVEFILPSAAELASLSDTGSLETATRALIGAQGAFSEFSAGVPATFANISKAADILAGGADASTASVETLNEGLADVGPVARTAGLSFLDVTAALAVLDKAQLKGSEGGRSLRTVLNGIFLRPQAQKEFAKLNIATINADGSIRNLDLIVKDMNKRYKELGFTQADIQRSLGEMAESFGRTGLSVLLANNGFSDMRDRIDESSSAADKARDVMDNLRGDIEQLRGSVETLQTKALLPLLQKAFRPIVQTIKAVVDAFIALPQPILDTVVNAIALISTFATLVGSTLIVVGVITRLGGVLLSLVGTFGSLITSLPTTIAAFAAFVGSFATAIVVITGFGAVVLGLGAIISKFTNDIEKNVKGAGNAFKLFKASVQKAFGTIGVLFTKLRVVVNSFFATLFSNASPQRGGIVAGVFKQITKSVNDFTNGLNQAIDLVDVFTQFLRGTGTQSAFAAYSNSLKELTKVPLVKRLFGDDVTMGELDHFFRAVKNTFDKILQTADDVRVGITEALFSGDTTKLKVAIKELFTGILKVVSGFTGIDFGSVILAVNEGNIRKAVQELADSIFHAIRQAINDNRDLLLDAGAAILNFIFNPVALPAKIAEFLGLTDIANVLAPISKTITDFFRNTIATVLDIIGGKSIADSLLGNFGEGAQPVADLINNVTTIIQNVVNFITTIAIPAIQTFINQLATFWEQVRPGVEEFATNFLENIIPSIANFINDVVIPAINELVRIVAELWTRVQPGVEAFGEWFLDVGLPAIVSFIQDTVIPEVNRFIELLANIWEFVRPGLEQLVNFIIANFVPGIQLIGQVIADAIRSFGNFVNGVREFGTTLTPILQGVADFIANTVVPIIVFAIDQAVKTIQFFVNVWEELFRAIKQFLEPAMVIIRIAFDAVGTVIEVALSLVRSFINIVSTIWDLVQAGLGLLRTGVETIFHAISAVLQPVIDFIGRIIGGFSGITNQVNHPLQLFFKIVEDVFGGIFDFISNVVLGIERVTQAIRDAVHEALQFTQVESSFNDTKITDTLARIDNLINHPDINATAPFLGLAEALRDEEIASNDAVNDLFNSLQSEVFAKFKQLFSETSGLADLTSEQISDVFKVLAKSGNVQDAIDLMGEDIRQLVIVSLQALKDPDIANEINFGDVIDKLLSPESLDKSTIGDLQGIGAVISDSLSKGKISADEAGEAVDKLAIRLAELRATTKGPLTDEQREQYNALTQFLLNLRDAYDLAGEAAISFGAAGGAGTGDKPGVIGNNGTKPLTHPQEIFDDIKAFVQGIVDGFNQGTAIEAENQDTFLQTVNEFGQELEDTAKEISDKVDSFNKDERRKLEDDLREEQESREKIDEIKKDALEKERDDIEDFHQDQIREEQDHQKKLLDIAKNADAAFNDAIANRDSAAAQSARVQLQEQTQQENTEFILKKKRDEENFQLDLERTRRERDQKILDAQVSLQDLIDKNQRERDRRVEDHNEEIAELEAHQLATQTEQEAFYASQQTGQVNQNNVMKTLFTLGMQGLNTAVAGGFGTAVQTATAILGGFINIFNGELQKIQQVAQSAVFNNSKFGGSQPFLAPPMDKGGPVKAFQPYQVSDPDAELLKIGNKTYLIPGKRGVVIPPTQAQRAGAGGGGNISVSFDFGGFAINGGGANAQELAGEIERIVVPRITKEIIRIKGS